MSVFRQQNIDWVLLGAVVPIMAAGLVTMHAFTSEAVLFTRQLLWIGVSLSLFFLLSFLDFRFLKRTWVLVFLYLFFIGLLLALFAVGSTVKGATSWFSVGGFSFQPVDFMKLVLILMLAKYFSRRHVEIRNVKHIFISGLYAALPFILVFFQPDFGSAMIIFLIWLGMAIVAGISKRHVFALLGLVVVLAGSMWLFVFEPYQKERILSFLHPLEDLTDSGYNAYQSTIAVGSGEVLGKGVGYGTQSRLQYLPEYETDFIFAAFAEEWGFVGVILLFILYGIVIWRILRTARRGATNFEMLYGVGLALLIVSHAVVNIGMNIGLLPVTGLTLPFMSYGGSHMVMLFVGLGVLMGMRRYAHSGDRDRLGNELIGI